MGRPKVGVAVIIVRDSKVLLGMRTRSHGAGTWHFPGGHLEKFESIEDCARREVKEETGLTINTVRIGPYTNDFFKVEDKHYITLFVVAESKEGNPLVLEPEKCEGWEWFAWNELPTPLFLSINNLLKLKFNPFS